MKRSNVVQFHAEDTARKELRGEDRRHCRFGTMHNYDPELDARADELEALRCLSYLLRNDSMQPQKVKDYLDQVDMVLDRMVDELKRTA